MINTNDILQTIQMIDKQHLDIRTITMGISLLDCCDPDPKAACRKIYDKITRSAQNLVRTGEAIEAEFGIPIVNKRISVTPIALVAGASETEGLCALRRCSGQGPGRHRRQLCGWLLRPSPKGHDPRRPQAHPRHSRGPGHHRAGVRLGEHRLHQGGHQHGRGGPSWDRPSNRPPSGRRPGAALAVPSWWYSATPWRTILSWLAPSTVCRRPTGSSTWVSPARAWSITPLQSVKGQPFDVVAETIKKTAFQVTRMGQLVAQEASRRLDVPFGIVDLSLAPTPAIGDSVARILGGDGPGGVRHPRHHRRAGPAQRRGEKGRRHGVLQRGRPFRRVYPRFGGRGHDRVGLLRRADAGQAGSHDLRLLRGSGYDRRPPATPPPRPSPPSSPTRRPSAWSTPRPPPCV